MKIKPILISLSLVTTSVAYGFMDFDNMFDYMHQQIKQMEEEFNESAARCGCGKPKPKPQSTPQVTVREHEDKNHVVVTVKPIEGQDFEAHLNAKNDTLQIKTLSDTIVLTTKERYLQVDVLSIHKVALESDEEEKENKEEKEQKNTGTESKTFTSRSLNSKATTLRYPILMDDQTIEYNKETKELTITFAINPAGKGKTVPVTIVEK